MRRRSEPEAQGSVEWELGAKGQEAEGDLNLRAVSEGCHMLG